MGENSYLCIVNERTTTMTREEIILAMQAFIDAQNGERNSIWEALKQTPTDSNLHHRLSKLGHEISALENAIRELERV